MPVKPTGKKVGFLMTFPFNSMMNPLMMDPLQMPFFTSNQQIPRPFQSQNPAPLPNQQQTQLRPQSQQQGGFSLSNIDSMFQNAKKFMGYIDQVRPVVKNFGPMLQMFTGTQAEYHLSKDHQRFIQKAVYTKKGKKK